MKNEVRPIDAKPLTLEQLRGMDGQPVWIKDIRDRKWFNPGWAIVDVSNRLVREAKNWNPVFFGDYGEQWLAYAYPPAHIDPLARAEAAEARAEKAERERDAAVEQLRGECEKCAHYRVTWNGCTPDFECPLSDRCLNRDLWEWDGGKKEE